MKKTILILLAAILFLCLSAPAFCEENSSKPKFEGEGFDTPEEAVLAYIDAWNRSDVNAAISTFAIESLVDHIDTRSYIEYFRMFNPTQNYLTVPAGSPWIRDLEVIKRYADVSNTLFNQYVKNNAGEYAKAAGQPVMVKTGEEIDALLDVFATPETESWSGRIRFQEWIDPVRIQKLVSFGNLRSITIQAEVYGADDIMPLIAHISLGKYQAILTMECLSYGGRWFNFRTYGNAAMVFNLEPMSGGLYVFPIEEAPELMRTFLTEPDAEAQAVLKSHLESSLTGTRWKLMKAAGGNEKFSVVDQPEKLKGWDQESDGVWAEMLFTRLGAVIHTYGVSSADPENLMSDRLYGMWNEEGNVIRFEGDLSGKGIMAENRLVITDESGMVLQFEKFDDCSVCKLH